MDKKRLLNYMDSILGISNSLKTYFTLENRKKLSNKLKFKYSSKEEKLKNHQ